VLLVRVMALGPAPRFVQLLRRRRADGQPDLPVPLPWLTTSCLSRQEFDESFRHWDRFRPSGINLAPPNCLKNKTKGPDHIFLLAVGTLTALA